MNEIKIFNNPEFGQIRTTTDEQGEPLFCLADVCGVLGLRVAAVAQRLKNDNLQNEKGRRWLHSLDLANYPTPKQRNDNEEFCDYDETGERNIY